MTVSTSVYQGDSSDILSVSVYEDDVLITDLTGYTAKIAVAKTVYGLALVEKNMVAVGSTFQVKLDPDETVDLSPGKYVIIVQVDNAGNSYRKEHHVVLTVNKQGLIDV